VAPAVAGLGDLTPFWWRVTPEEIDHLLTDAVADHFFAKRETRRVWASTPRCVRVLPCETGRPRSGLG
jgi:hypothetical protein